MDFKANDVSFREYLPGALRRGRAGADPGGRGKRAGHGSIDEGAAPRKTSADLSCSPAARSFCGNRAVLRILRCGPTPFCV